MRDRFRSPLLARKAEIEHAMFADPGNAALRDTYFQALQAVSAETFGPIWVVLPELRTPLLLRGGTSDIGNLEQLFFARFGETTEAYGYGDYGFAMAPPEYILDLGAYCGYTAVYFANRFPAARIIAVEPPGPNFDSLRINTAAYPAISCVPAAVWYENTKLRLGGHIYGDWGKFFTPESGATANEDGLVTALTIPDLLQQFGWDHVDYLKCVVEGGQVEILTAEDRPWLNRVACVTTRPPTGVWPRPDDESRLIAAFPQPTFNAMQYGELAVFQRREEPGSVRVAAPRPLHLLPSVPDLQAYVLQDVGLDWDRFHRFDYAGMHLAPNAPDAPDATIRFTVDLDGHSGFTAEVSGNAGEGRQIIFQMLLQRQDGATAASASQVVEGTAPVTWTVPFPAASGPHVVSLSTRQAGSGNWAEAAARFIDPRLV